jgi:hypothetical protein
MAHVPISFCGSWWSTAAGRLSAQVLLLMAALGVAIPPVVDRTTFAATLTVPYTETFATGDANWKILSGDVPTWVQSVAVFVCPSMILPSPPPALGWSSYAICSGAAYGHFVNAWHPEYHNGAIVEPGKGRVRLDAIAAADGNSKTFPSPR